MWHLRTWRRNGRLCVLSCSKDWWLAPSGDVVKKTNEENRMPVINVKLAITDDLKNGAEYYVIQKSISYFVLQNIYVK